MSELTRKAWKAYFRGNYLQAGDFYKAAGELEKASRMYLKGGDLRAAAEVEETLGRVTQAVEYLLRAGDPNSAALLLGRHGHYTRAAQVYAEAGNKVQAAAMALKGGNQALASQLLEQAGRYMEAGRLAFQSGNVGRALLLFEKVLKQLPDSDSLTPSEALQQREQLMEVARYFEEGEAYDRAAEIHERLNDLLGAAQCYEAAKQYEKAAEYYRRVGALDRLGALGQKGAGAPLAVQAEALAARGDAEEAARLFAEAGLKDRAAALYEECGHLAAAAELRRELGDFEMAGNLFYRSQAFLPAAQCYEQAHLFTMAEQCYLKAGDNSRAARMAFEAGHWERAVALASEEEDRRAFLERIQAFPDNPPERVRLSLLKTRLFLDLGEPSVAAACLEGVSPGSLDEEAWYHYLTGRVREALGNAPGAEEAYKKALAVNVSFEDAKKRLEAVKQWSARPARQRDRYGEVGPAWADSLGPWVRAEDTLLRTPVLLHRIADSRGLSPGLFEPEHLERLLSLRHPSILGLRDAIPTAGGPEFVYEDFGGRPLTEWVAEGYRPSGHAALEKLRPILEALAEAHRRGLPHNRLGAEHVLMDREGRVRLHGFGLFPPQPRRSPADTGAPSVEPAEFQTDPGPDLRAAAGLVAGLLLGSFDAPFLPGAPFPPPELDISAPAGEFLARLAGRDPDRAYKTIEEALHDLAAQELHPGVLVAGRYEILEELGRGGMGQVFRVRDRELGEEVALKTLRRRPEMTEEARARFLREIKLSRRITHPNVVRVYDFGVWRDTLFLTMEFIPGKTLSQWVREGSHLKANLRQKVEILRGIAAGLHEAHKAGVIHRDLKPQNVILTPSGIPKILDFGIAHANLEESGELTQEGHFVGSPKYVSPEQIQGLPLDPRSDIYALGLLAYFLLTGQDAFTGDKSGLILLKQLREMPPPPSRFHRLPPTLERLVMACLAKKPEERPASMEEVSRLLKEIA
ncbi:MAG: protein kinase domain-containing protein [Acidobacteriota bacterium]